MKTIFSFLLITSVAQLTANNDTASAVNKLLVAGSGAGVGYVAYCAGNETLNLACKYNVLHTVHSGFFPRALLLNTAVAAGVLYGAHKYLSPEAEELTDKESAKVATVAAVLASAFCIIVDANAGFTK